MIGQTLNITVRAELHLADAAQRAAFGERLRVEGKSRGATAIDYFVFTAGLFDPIPAFVVGRARFDNWLVWRARQSAPVIDASRSVRAAHQAHDYAHVDGGLMGAHAGPEAERNEGLAGGTNRIFTMHDASHRLRADGTIVRNLGAVLRVRETVRKAAWKVAQRR
jgi:hypothetical protein